MVLCRALIRVLGSAPVRLAALLHKGHDPAGHREAHRVQLLHHGPRIGELAAVKVEVAISRLPPAGGGRSCRQSQAGELGEQGASRRAVVAEKGMAALAAWPGARWASAPSGWLGAPPRLERTRHPQPAIHDPTRPATPPAAVAPQRGAARQGEAAAGGREQGQKAEQHSAARHAPVVNLHHAARQPALHDLLRILEHLRGRVCVCVLQELGASWPNDSPLLCCALLCCRGASAAAAGERSAQQPPAGAAERCDPMPAPLPGSQVTPLPTHDITTRSPPPPPTTPAHLALVHICLEARPGRPDGCAQHRLRRQLQHAGGSRGAATQARSYAHRPTAQLQGRAGQAGDPQGWILGGMPFRRYPPPRPAFWTRGGRCCPCPARCAPSWAG